MKQKIYFSQQQKSQLQKAIEKQYDTLKRLIVWQQNKKKYSKGKSNTPYLYSYIIQTTPLCVQLHTIETEIHENNAHNLKIACKKINGIIIRPGKTFSFWKLIGKPSKRNGYKTGLILDEDEIRTNIGGGLHQLANLIYEMAIHTPLTINEYHFLPYDIYPETDSLKILGGGLTCIYNYKDLQFTNNTNVPIQIMIKATDSELTGSFFSLEKSAYTYHVYEKEHNIKRDSSGEFWRYSTIYRQILKDNVAVEDQFLFENQVMILHKPLSKEINKKDLRLQHSNITLKYSTTIG